MTIIVSVTVQDEAHRIAVAVDAEYPDPAYFTLTRIVGGRSEPVRGDESAFRFRAIGPTRTLFDVEAPRGVPVAYVASAVDQAGAMTTSATSAPVMHDPVACDWWAAPLTAPGDTVEFEPEAQDSADYVAEHGTFHALGRADPIVLFGTRHTATGSLLIWCEDYDRIEAIRAVIGLDEPIVVRSPAVTGWGQDGRRYVAFDTLGYRRNGVGPVAPAGPRSEWSLDAPWTELRGAGLPSSVVGYGATYQDVLDQFPTYGLLPGVFATYDALVGWVVVA